MVKLQDTPGKAHTGSEPGSRTIFIVHLPCMLQALLVQCSSAVQAFARIIPNHTLQLVEGADHNFRAAAASRQAVLAAADFITATAGASA